MIVPVTGDDLLHILRNMRAADREEVFALRDHDSVERLADEMRMVRPMAFIVRHGETPAAVAGAYRVRSGVWSVFMVATDDWPKVALATTRAIVKGLIPYLKEAGAHRAECYSHAGHETAHRWLVMLGATPEARLRAYGRNGEDYVLFRWLRKE